VQQFLQATAGLLLFQQGLTAVGAAGSQGAGGAVDLLAGREYGLGRGLEVLPGAGKLLAGGLYGSGPQGQLADRLLAGFGKTGNALPAGARPPCP